ncbi:MAG: DUF885 domain-containing protein [Planctomycetota bacterium]|nr:MAG: DUF885 domain-containing protein [Planctomycetota bacterium]
MISLLLVCLQAGQPIQLAEALQPSQLAAPYQADRAALRRLWSFPWSPAGRAASRSLQQDWLAALDNLEFSNLSRSEQVEWHLLKNEILHDQAALMAEIRREEEVAALVPFAGPLVSLLEARGFRELPDPEASASILHESLDRLRQAKKDLKKNKPEVSAAVARRAARKTASLRRSLASWFQFGSGYHPLFTWWCQEPWEAFQGALRDYENFLEKEIGGLDPKDQDALVGDPIGRQALLEELAFEWIPYTPEELIQIAEKEMEWCLRQRKEAAQALGFGDDWKAAQDHVKTLHVEPGEQPALIRMLADEAVDFLESRDLLTIPDLAKQVWRMEMMSPQRQKFSPYFTGGEVISISYPTAGMDHEDKLMSMKGNNIHFSRATVHHELIPGHHLQGYMSQRWNPHRRLYSTPFSVEGWALYWEMRLWELGFPQTPEDRIGMLFWRAHRCARIQFSLSFHLGLWSPEQCVDFLVKAVGHEPRNAEAEVRRSIQGGYGPLYQCAYLLGGLQLRALHRELVESGDWSEKAFHDRVLQENSIPIEILRQAMSDLPWPSPSSSRWRFYPEF